MQSSLANMMLKKYSTLQVCFYGNLLLAFAALYPRVYKI